MPTTFAFETKIVPAASTQPRKQNHASMVLLRSEGCLALAKRTARKCTEKYIEHGTEPMERFGAKSLWQDRAWPELEQGGA